MSEMLGAWLLDLDLFFPDPPAISVYSYFCIFQVKMS